MPYRLLIRMENCPLRFPFSASSLLELSAAKSASKRTTTRKVHRIKPDSARIGVGMRSRPAPALLLMIASFLAYLLHSHTVRAFLSETTRLFSKFVLGAS